VPAPIEFRAFRLADESTPGAAVMVTLFFTEIAFLVIKILSSPSERTSVPKIRFLSFSAVNIRSAAGAKIA
jgi:hypothetical protein